MYQVLFFIALLIGIIPFLLLLAQQRVLNITEPVIPFIWLTAIATLYEFFGSVILKINTSYWWQLYSLLEFLTLYYFFYKIFRPSYKRTLLVFIILLCITYIISFMFWDENNKFVSKAINKIPITLFVFLFSFKWFKDLFKKMEVLNPWQKSNFYFVSGISIYYSSTLFLFLLSNYFFKSTTYMYDYWLVNIIATFVLRLSLIIGVWKMKRK